MELPKGGRVKIRNILGRYDRAGIRPVARWGISWVGITGSKVEGGRSGWKTGNVYSGGGCLGWIIILGCRRKRLEDELSDVAED